MLGVHRVIAIGASAGGLEALQAVVRGLPGDIPAAILVVMHVAPAARSVLADILKRSARLTVLNARDGAPVERSCLYVAPPDHHMLIRGGAIRLAKGPRENHQRPAIDPLFRSVARNYGRRGVGVILSGTLDDGTAGLMAIHRAGGACVVQSPQDALYAGMPESAIENVPTDHVVTAEAMGAVLDRIVRAPLHAGLEAKPSVPDEDKIAEFDERAMHEAMLNGKPANLSCPDCGGTLVELKDGKLEHYRCRVGHAYSLDTLTEAKTEKVEEALWVALRALEEHADVTRRASVRARVHGFDRAASDLERAAEDDGQRAELIRGILETNGAKGLFLGVPERAGKAPTEAEKEGRAEES